MNKLQAKRLAYFIASVEIQNYLQSGGMTSLKEVKTARDEQLMENALQELSDRLRGQSKDTSVGPDNYKPSIFSR